MVETIQKYRKALVAVIGALAVVLGENETYQTVVAVLTALGVYVVPNKK